MSKYNSFLTLLLVALVSMSCERLEDLFPYQPASHQFPEVDTTIIRTDFPFASRFVKVNGAKMHYVDEGQGEVTYLLLHGQPTSVYLWRNIILHLRRKGRVVAPDLIGFGKSDKPSIDYSFQDHRTYIQAFVDQLQLKNVVLVVHDWGSGIGFDYAARNADNVRGLVFFEAMLDPITGFDDVPPGTEDLFRAWRSGTEGDTTTGSGWDLIVRQNMFLDVILPNFVLRPLQSAEVAAYQAPFLKEEDRKPIWRFPRELPIGGEPADVFAAQEAYNEYLQTTSTPKLYLYATPGALNLENEALPYVRNNFPNTDIVFLGEGLHFLQEDHPHQIGLSVLRWADKNF